MPATAPLGGNARGVFACRGSCAITQGKYKAEFAAFAPAMAPAEAETLATVAVSAQSTIKNARRFAASACSIAIAAASVRPGTQMRLNDGSNSANAAPFARAALSAATNA